MADPVIPPPPEGFVVDNVPPPPPGFVADQPSAAVAVEQTVEEPPIPDVITPEVMRVGEEPEQTVFENIGEDLERRGQEFQEIISDPEQTRAETALQIAGKTVLGSGLDIAGEVADAALEFVGEGIQAITPDPVLEAVEEGTDAALEWALGSELGQMGLDAAQAGVEAWQEFKEANPRAARNIESVINIGLVAAPARAAIGSRTPRFTRRALRDITDSETLFNEAKKSFTKARQAGGALDADDFVDFLAAYERAFSKQIDPTLHPRVTGTLNLLTRRIGDDLDVDDLMLVRRVVSDIGSSVSPDEQRLGLELLSKFDEFVEGLPGDQAWRQARSQYFRGIKTQMVEEAIERAGRQASGLENGLRIQFRQILNNKKLRNRFNKDEIDAMQNVVDGDFTTNNLRRLGVFGAGLGDSGSRRTSVSSVIGAAAGAGGGGLAGGPAGGVVGAVAVPAAGAVSQAIATRRTQRAADIVRALTSGARPELPARVGPAVRRGAAALAISEAGDEEE